MKLLTRVFTSLIILFGLSSSVSSSMIVGVRVEKLYVIDYWEENEGLEHKMLILNRSTKAIQLDVRILTILSNQKEYIDSGEFIGSLSLAPSEYHILNYPGAEHWKRYLRFLVDGHSVGIIQIVMVEPSFKITNGKVVTNCNPNGNHYRNLWFVLDDIVIPHQDKYTFRAIMECKRSSGPDYLLFAQSKTRVKLKDNLVLQSYEDDVYDYNFDHLIEYPEYEYEEPCYKRFDVTIEDPTYLPFVSSYYFMAISGGNKSWYQLPLIFEMKL
ncbi:MAG: hypothetical protein MIO92_15440 [Methanosarcinaceae archaeon]|nr:hypothetical protein [Methanosarcinaceae archaeon]